MVMRSIVESPTTRIQVDRPAPTTLLTASQAEVAEAIVVGLNRRGVAIATNQLFPFLLDEVGRRMSGGRPGPLF